MNADEPVLVTGATGFIGSHLVRFLVDQGISTYCLVRDSCRSPEVIDRLRGACLVTLRGHDSEELRNAMSGMEPPQVIFHLASAGVLQDKDTPQDVVETNVHLMTQLLIAAAKWPVRRFLYTGSCAEYALATGDRLSEDSPLLPSSVYGASKAAAYICGRSLAASLGISFANLRLFGVYGSGEASQRLIPFLIDRLVNRQPAELTGGNQIRDLLFVDDVVRALWFASRCAELSKHDVYNICSGVGVSVRQVGGQVAQQLNVPTSLLKWGARPYRPDEPMAIVGTNQRFVELTGWQPHTTLEQGVARMIHAFTAQPARHAA